MKNLLMFFATIMLRVGGAGAQFALTAIVAALVSTSLAGQFFFCMAASVVWSNIIVFGLNGLSLRDMGRMGECDRGSLDIRLEIANKISAVVTVVICMVLVISLFVAIFNALNFIDDEYAFLVVVFILASAFQAINLVAGYVLQGLQNNIISVLSLSVNIPILFIISFIVIRATNISEMSLLYLGSVFFGALISLIMLWIKCRYLSSAFTVNIIKSMIELRKAKGFALLNIVLIMSKWGGVLLAGILLTKEDTAQFSVSYRLSQMVSLVLLGISMIAAPRLAQIHGKGSSHELVKYFRKVWVICMALGGGAAVVVLFGWSRILGFLGPHYSSDYIVLVILVLGQLVNVATGPIGYVLTMGGRESDMRRCLTAGLLALILSSVVASFFVGMKGLALGVTLSLVIQNILAIVFVNRRFMVRLYGVI